MSQRFEIILLNSSLVKEGDDIDNNQTTADIKIMFCFKVPELQKKNSGTLISMGTTVKYDYPGEI